MNDKRSQSENTILDTPLKEFPDSDWLVAPAAPPPPLRTAPKKHEGR